MADKPIGEIMPRKRHIHCVKCNGGWLTNINHCFIFMPCDDRGIRCQRETFPPFTTGAIRIKR